MPKHAQRLLEQSQVIPSQREHAAAPDRVQLAAPSAILQRAALAPQSLRPPDIQRLQQTLGNRAVAQLLSQGSQSRSLVQAKLAINAPGDRYEQEADRVAEEVMRNPGLQRAEAEEREDEDETPSIMTKPQPSSTGRGAFEANEGFERQLQAARGQGRPLPPALKENFETKFGADFGGVRIHADLQADQLSRSIQARAFTTGQDVFFRRGAYQPESHVGQKLVAHELTHVVQQSGGPQGGGVIQRDVGFEFETDWGIHGGRDEKKKSDPALKKHRAYKKLDGFEVQVDEASRGFKKEYSKLGYQIEFVLKPHPETDQGGKQLEHTLEQLLKEVKWLEGRAKKYPDGFMLHEPEEELWVFPKAKNTAKPQNIQARAQATIGLSLRGIHRYGMIEETKLQHRYNTKEYSVVHRQATLGKDTAVFISIAQRVDKKIKNAELRGLVTLLAFYVRVFQHPSTLKAAPYAKSVVPILAKTNFATMFSHLEKKTKKKYSSDTKNFAKLVIGILNDVKGDRPAITGDEPMITDKAVSKSKIKKVGELTVKAWLRGIPNGVDKLTEQYYDELFGFGNLGGVEGKGGKGDKVDLTGGTAAMVLEFRSGAPRGFLPPEEWSKFAFDYFHLVRLLHGSGNIQPSPPKRREL